MLIIFLMSFVNSPFDNSSRKTTVERAQVIESFRLKTKTTLRIFILNKFILKYRHSRRVKSGMGNNLKLKYLMRVNRSAASFLIWKKLFISIIS